MKVKELLEEVEEKEFFKKFKLQNPKSFFYAGFFILDLENKTEKIQLDFYNPIKNKIEITEFPFEKIKIQENKIPRMKEPEINPEKMKPLLLNLKIDIDDLKSSCKEILEKNKSLLNPTKIIAILKDNSWNLTCMDNHLGMARIRVNALSGEEQSFEKLNMMDFMGVKKL